MGLHIQWLQLTAVWVLQVAPALAWNEDRILSDLKLSSQLMGKLDEEKGIEEHNPLKGALSQAQQEPVAAAADTAAAANAEQEQQEASAGEGIVVF